MATGAIIAAGAIASYASSRSASKRAAAANAAAAAQAQAQFLIMVGRMDEAYALLEEVGVPSIEAQRIMVEGPDAVADLISEATGIQPDQRLVDHQMQSLEALGEISETGRSGSEQAEDLLTSRQLSGERQAQEKATQQQMAARGMSGSGMEMAGRLGAQQTAAISRELGSAQRLGKAKDRALNAMVQKGQMAGQMGQQQHSQAMQRANALDATNKFNTQNKWNYNVGQTNAANQQEMHNKGLLQQDYQNRLSKAQAMANAKIGQANVAGQMGNMAMQQGQNVAQGHLNQGAAQSQLFGSLAGAGAGAYNSSQDRKAYNRRTDAMESANGSIIDDEGRYNEGGSVPTLRELLEMKEGKEPQQFAGGDIAVSGLEEEGEDQLLKGDIVPGNEYAGDRVDAKVNSGEMVLNVPQQQRLMELLKGYRSLADLGDDNIAQDQMGNPAEAPVEGGIPGQEQPGAFPPGGPEGAPPPPGGPGVPPGAAGMPSVGDGGAPPMPPMGPEGMPPQGPPPGMEDGGSIFDSLFENPNRKKARELNEAARRRRREEEDKDRRLRERESEYTGGNGERRREEFAHGGVPGASQYGHGSSEYPRNGDDSESRYSINDFNGANKDTEPDWKRGLTAKLDRLDKDESDDKEKSKHRSAHMKALEVLTGKKKQQDTPPLS